MHKFFAKTLFLGKNVVFLPQCHSTNDLAKELSKQGRLPEGSVIWTDHQFKGRGQQGNIWFSEASKNLLFTLFLKPDHLTAKEQFRLNMLASLAVTRLIANHLPAEEINVKWPNDVYIKDRKVAGILIETMISGQHIDEVFCGIGLNVNQSHFVIPTATSLRMETGQFYDLSSQLELLLLSIEQYYEGLFIGGQLKADYMNKMRWLNELHTFEVDSRQERGEIIGISESGKLEVKIGDSIQSFANKEIVFLE